MINVASAGNGGATSEPGVIFPAKDPNAIAVAGVPPSGQRRAESSYGPELDLAAPMQTYALNNIDAPIYFEGTSASSPFIAGLAAVFKGTAPREADRPASAVNDRDAFVAAARVMTDGSVRAWSPDIGYGVPDLYATIWTGPCTRFDMTADGEVDVGDGQTMASRYGVVTGDPRYSTKYDIHPSMQPDGDVDIQDLQKVFGRNFTTCR